MRQFSIDGFSIASYHYVNYGAIHFYTCFSTHTRTHMMRCNHALFNYTYVGCDIFICVSFYFSDFIDLWVFELLLSHLVVVHALWLTGIISMLCTITLYSFIHIHMMMLNNTNSDLISFLHIIFCSQFLHTHTPLNATCKSRV